MAKRIKDKVEVVEEVKGEGTVTSTTIVGWLKKVSDGLMSIIALMSLVFGSFLFSVGRLPLKTASPWRLGGLAALVPGILAARAPAFVKSAGPGAIPGKIGQVHSIGGGGQGVTLPSPRCFQLIGSRLSLQTGP